MEIFFIISEEKCCYALVKRGKAGSNSKNVIHNNLIKVQHPPGCACTNPSLNNKVN